MTKRKFERLSREEKRLVLALAAGAILEDLGEERAAKAIMDRAAQAFVAIAIQKLEATPSDIAERGSGMLFDEYRDEFSYAVVSILEYITAELKRVVREGKLPNAL